MSTAVVTEPTTTAAPLAERARARAAPLAERARARAAELRQQAEQVKLRAELEISALLTAAGELEALLREEASRGDNPA